MQSTSKLIIHIWALCLASYNLVPDKVKYVLMKTTYNVNLSSKHSIETNWFRIYSDSKLFKAKSNVGQLRHKIVILSFSEVSDHTLLICESLTLKVCESMCCSIYLIARSVEFDITMSQYKSATVNLFCHSACWVRAILFCWDGVLFTFSQLTQLWKLILIGFHSIWFHHQCHEKHCEVWLSNPTPLTTCWWSVRPLPKSTIP